MFHRFSFRCADTRSLHTHTHTVKHTLVSSLSQWPTFKYFGDYILFHRKKIHPSILGVPIHPLYDMAFPFEAFLIQLFLGDLEAAAHRSTWSTVAGDPTFKRSKVPRERPGWSRSDEHLDMSYWGYNPSYPFIIYKAIYRGYNSICN